MTIRTGGIIDRAGKTGMFALVGMELVVYLGDHLFSNSGRSLADAVGRLRVARKTALAVAESCTGGMIGNWLTNCAGSSE